MSVNVLTDLSKCDGKGNGGVVVLESDNPVLQEAFAELQHQDARSKATSYAVANWGMQKVGVSGMSMHPYAVNEKGKSFDDFQAEGGKIAEFVPSKYRMDVPVQGNTP